MARAHGKQEWTITELPASIRDELHILEIGSQTELHTMVPPTAAFYSGVTKPKGRIQCPFCKGAHSASVYQQIKDPWQHINIIRQFQLLGSLTVIQSTGVTAVEEKTTPVCVPMNLYRLTPVLQHILVMWQTLNSTNTVAHSSNVVTLPSYDSKQVVPPSFNPPTQTQWYRLVFSDPPTSTR